MFIAFFMQLFATESDNFTRITDYFYIFVILFISEILASIYNRNIYIISHIIVTCLFFAYFIYIIPDSKLAVVPYKFFWQ